MNNSKTIPAIITPTLALNASASSPYYDINITQQLCQPACVDETPVFTPAFSPIYVEPVGTNQYMAYIHVEGVISYAPCGCGTCATRSQIVSQDFALPVYSTTAISGVTIEAGATRNAVQRMACCQCSKTFVSNTPITVTFTTA